MRNGISTRARRLNAIPRRPATALRLLAGAVVLLGGLAIHTPAHATTDTGRPLMDKVYAQRSSSDAVYNFSMIIRYKRGGEVERKLVRYTHQTGPHTESQMLRFEAPADLRGTGLLVIENASRSDDVWLYLPALHRIRRISGSSNHDYFMGSDFTYKDLKSENLVANDYQVVKSDTVGGVDCTVIDATPNNDHEKEESGYSRRRLWIDPNRDVILRIDYYDRFGDLIKRYTANDFRQVADKWRPFAMHMDNYQEKRATTLSFTHIELNNGRAERHISKRELRREW